MVVFDDTPAPVTTIRDMLIDPENGKIVAFLVNTGHNEVITPIDILSWREVMTIHNFDSIVQAEDILRAHEILESGIMLRGSKVETEKGKYLGRVTDYAVDTNTFDLRRIEVAKAFLGLIRFETRLIPAKEIVEILPGKIVVKEDMKVIREGIGEKEVAAQDMAAA